MRTFWACGALACVAVAAVAGSRKEEGMEGRMQTVLEGGNAWIAADLRIGGGNFDFEHYVSDSGTSTRGWTAALWISVPDEVGGGWRQAHVRVRPGQKLVLARYRIDVVDVSRPEPRGVIRLNVIPLQAD